MKDLGKYLNIKKRISPLDEKELFCEIVDLYESVALRGHNTYEDVGINLAEYDEEFYVIIENLIYLKYGEWKTEIITWYVWDRKNLITGEIGLLEWSNEKTEEVKEVLIKCAEDLWDILKEIENQED